jgi:hypothetical protein
MAPREIREVGTDKPVVGGDVSLLWTCKAIEDRETWTAR